MLTFISALSGVANNSCCVEPKLCLASESPRRAKILSDAGIGFIVEPSHIDENLVDMADPEAKVIFLAELKARQVAQRKTGTTVIAADTLVVLDGVAMGKPKSREEATGMLRSLRGRIHNVITGVAVIGPNGNSSGVEKTDVHFRVYSDEEIEEYVASGSPLDKAGAYGIQDKVFAPACNLTGCYLNVVGLPLCLAGRLFGGINALTETSSSLAFICPGHNYRPVVS